MIENLERFLSYQSYDKLTTNIEDVTVFYQVEEPLVKVIVVNKLVGGIELTKEQYQYILTQIEEGFRKRGYTEVAILSLLCTKNIDRVRSYCEVEKYVHWIVDLENNRLVIYENQPSQFYQVREQLESILIGKLHTIHSEYSREDNPVRTEATFGHKVKSGHFIHRFRDYVRYRPFFTILLIAINGLVFLLLEATGSSLDGKHLLNWGGSAYDKIVYEHEYFRLFTAMFLHAGTEHLINNMFILFIIGERLERILGGVRYLTVYLSSGLIASIGSVIYYHLQNENPVGVGASGAILGILGGVVYLVIRYRGRGLGITPERIILFTVLTLYSGFRSAETVDNTAHVVGFIAGFVITMLIDSLQQRKRKNRWYQ